MGTGLVLLWDGGDLQVTEGIHQKLEESSGRTAADNDQRSKACLALGSMDLVPHTHVKLASPSSSLLYSQISASSFPLMLSRRSYSVVLCWMSLRM
ncbi:hypothetical protein EYF80_043019 [Liparis tanakae]|uniref:Uncharacterized protein n=1 Tax=Liparis tanakae TaxID=230148 RepID=A0A4Z2FZP6_9TELE|nr:hypothetical protein EYF80_043019 [Liparis tanakae]